MDPRPLSPIFSSPRELLEKAKRDLGRLDDASSGYDDIRQRDAMMDACVSVYHIKDWVGAMFPSHKDAAGEYARKSLWILMCRDICHASKHVGLSLKRSPYKADPPRIREVNHTIDASMDDDDPIAQVLEIRSEKHGGHYARDVIAKAIADWEIFLNCRKIP